ncbi:MAG: Ig-like domain-containing protein [Pseudomonadota bacterium]
MFQRSFIALVAALACAAAQASPVVSLTTPAANSKYLPPASVAISATATDSADTIAKVDFYAGTTLIGTATSAPYATTWTNVAAGTYALSAKATNSHGIVKASAARSITVNTSPTVAIISPVAAASFTGLANVTINANASDLDGNLAKVDFYHNGVLIGTATSVPYSATWANVVPGSYSLTAKATDSMGAVTSSSAVAITVTNPLTVSLAAPATNSRFLPGAPITFTANAADANSAASIAKVDFTAGGTLIGTATAAPYSIVWNNAASGIYPVTATVTDSQGLSKTSSAIKVTVDAPPTVALTLPATGATFVGLATINLAADVGDQDGAIAKVQFYRSGTLIATATSAPFTATWAGAAPGTYSITARATDNLGVVTTSTASTITVTNPVTVSIAAPLSNARFVPPAAIDLSANAVDSNGSIAKVDFYNGTALIGSVTTAPYTVPWTNVAAGKYTITAKATDNQGISKTSSAVTIIVDTSPNVAITTPVTHTAFNAPASIDIAAAASAPDGTIAKVQFYRGTTLLATSTSAPYTATWSNVAKGSYSITAKATDNLGVTTTSAPVLVTVGSNAAPTITLANGTPAGAIAPATVNLSATASDSDGTIAQVEFFNGEALIGRSTSAPFSFNWINVDAGSYAITAKATDNLGASSSSAPLNVLVVPNNAPTVALTSPTDGSRLIGPVDITLAATASDLDGSVAKVEFLDGDTVLGSIDAAPYTLKLAGVTPGSYQFAARATDNRGLVSTSASAAVTVVTNGAPSVTLTATPSVATAPATVTLDAVASDGDGSIKQVEFFNGATSLGKVAAAPFIFTWTNVAAGSYSVSAVATDNLGATTTSQAVAVMVNTPPTVAIGVPVANSIYAAPASVTLTADASAASGARIATVDFYNGVTLIATAKQAPYAVSVPDLAAGDYTITAVATDSVGASATSAAVNFTVVTNAAPTVTLTAGTMAPGAPATIILTANAIDIDGTIAKVDFYSGATLLGSSTQAPYAYTLFNAVAGTYNFTAVATDNLGTSMTSQAASVTVNALPTLAITLPASTNYAAPATINLAATAAATATGASITQVAYYRENALIGTATMPPYNLSVVNVVAGSYTISAVATDSLGNTARSASITALVVDDLGPLVSVTATPGTAIAPAAITLSASATSAISVTKVDFYNGQTLLGTANKAPYQYNWTGVAAGTYNITAKATDSLNVGTTSQPVAVTVTGVGAQVYYVFADQINTPKLVTDSTGAPVWQMDTDPFGANLPNENVSGQTFTYNQRFPGQYYDKETNLHYNVFRDYDPQTGRYVESDPIGLDGGINTFAYGLGNPVSNVDPLGLLVPPGIPPSLLPLVTPKVSPNPFILVGSIAGAAGAWTYAYCHKDDDKDKADKCKEILEKLWGAMNVVEGRMGDLIQDKLDLYNKAYSAPSPSLPKGSGSWTGHIEQASGWQRRVRALIKEALDNGCKVPKWAWDIAYTPIPSRPGAR